MYAAIELSTFACPFKHYPRNLHRINFTFTLLNEGPLAQSANGNHTIAIFQVPEKYAALSEALTDIAREASELQTIRARIMWNTFLVGTSLIPRPFIKNKGLVYTVCACVEPLAN